MHTIYKCQVHNEKRKLACHKESMQALKTACNSGLVQLSLWVNKLTHDHDVERQKCHPTSRVSMIHQVKSLQE